MNIKWKRGEFYEFRAITKVHLGAVEEDIFEDDIVEFDGQTLRYAGADYAVPSLRAAVKEGWLVPSEDNVSHYVSQPAGVKVRPATPQTEGGFEGSTFETAHEEEAVVGTLSAHKKRWKSAGSQPSRKLRTRAASKPVERHTRKEAAPPPRPAPKPVRVEKPTPVEYEPDELVTSEEVDAVKRADAINRRRIAEALAQEIPDPVEYDDEYEDEDDSGGFSGTVVHVDDQDGEAVGNYKFTNAAAVGVPGDKHLREGTSVNRMSRNVGKPVAKTPKRKIRVKKTQVPAEGNTDISETHSTGATGDVAEAISGADLTDLLPSAAQGAEPSTKIHWDKSPHWRTRVQIAVDQYGDNPEALAQVKAVETPGVCKHIDQKLAKR